MNDSRAQQTERWLQELLNTELGQRGLEWIPHLHQFRQVFPGGFFCVILSVSGYPDCALAEAHVGIRLDDVENLSFPHTNNPLGFQPNSMTLVTPLARLLGERLLRYEIFKEEDAKSVAWQMLPLLIEKGLPFLAKYQDAHAMERLYNEQPHFPVPYLHNPIHRCFRGIALAKLVGNTEFSHLCSTYRQVLKNRFAPEQTILKFEELVTFLKDYSQN
jgi:hypothetical protein